MEARRFGWTDIVRLGMVQASLGAIVVLMTSTLNRIMVVELTLPALLPGALVALLPDRATTLSALQQGRRHLGERLRLRLEGERRHLGQQRRQLQ